MRKRSRGRGINNRGGRGAAGSSSRGARGKSNLTTQLPQRQSSLAAPSTIKFVSRGNSYYNNDDNDKLDHLEQQSSYLNGTSNSRNPIGELKIKNGFAVNSIASIMESAAAVIDRTNFYLHKKFKKVSSTNEINSNSDSLEDEILPTNENSGSEKTNVRVDRKRKNGTVDVPIPSIRDVINSSSNLSISNFSSHSKEKDKHVVGNYQARTFLSKFENSKEIQIFNNVIATSNDNSNSSLVPESSPSKTASTNSTNIFSKEIVNSNNGNSATVYKPKFHKIIASTSANSHIDNQRQLLFENGLSPNINSISSHSQQPHKRFSAPTYPSNTANLSISSTSQQQYFPFTTTMTNRISTTASATTITTAPGKITGDRQRIDRQSLDDHISKIIEENQSILATLPEYSSRRHKSHHNSGGSSMSNSSSSFSSSNSTRLQKSPSISAMSTGSTTEQMESSTAFDLSMRKSSKDNSNYVSPSKVKPKTTLMRSHSDLNESLLLRNLHLTQSSSSMSSLETKNKILLDRKPDEMHALHPEILEEAQFVVPKKRRKLSPATFCGGEVSEMPNHELASKSKNDEMSALQDIDMTVRVSNCSGAKVTVRANNIGSNSNTNNNRKISNVSSSGGYVSVMGDGNFSKNNVYQNHKIMMGTESSTMSRFLSVISPHNNEVKDQRMILYKDDQIINLKVGKQRGRPPKKIIAETSNNRKISDGLVSYTTPLQLMSPALSLSSSAYGRKSSAMLPSPSPMDLKITTAASSSRNTIETSKMNDSTLMNLSLPSPISLPPKTAALLKETTKFSSDAIKHEKNICLEKPYFLQSSIPNPKRPNFLELRPMNPSIKKNFFDSSLVLPSPDTPRAGKSYNQMYINGHAYTYLGFKVSTRSSYTCLFRPQPMFIPQETDPKLSMYSNWQPRPRDPSATITTISTNDSRVNGRRSPLTSLYVSATGKHCGTMTVGSSGQQAPILSTFDSNIITLTKGSPSGQHICDTVTSNSSHTSPVAETDSISSVGLITTSSPTSSLQSSISSSLPQNFMTHHQQSRTSELKGNDSGTSSATSTVSQKSRKRHPHKYLHSNRDKVYSATSTFPQQNFHSKLATSSTSDFSGSADDESNGSNSRHNSFHQDTIRISDDVQQRNDSSTCLLLNQNINKESGMKGHDDEFRFASRSTSPNSLAILESRLEQAKVRVIEGGFESNEDYTYIRGRGRGRYVCEACGIRCKKPSMLRKHLKTHTDLRPYTCKLCNFSFKTKGNLTKHQKSKSHHKKCFGLGIDPKSSRSLAMIGPTSDTDDDDSDDGDDDDNGDDDEEIDSNDDEAGHSSSQDMEAENNIFEKEIAQSLLDLSRMTSFGKINNEDYSNSRIMRNETAKEKFLFSENEPLSLTVKEQKASKGLTDLGTNARSTNLSECPIDLSVRNVTNEESKSLKLEKTPNGIVRSMGIVGEAQRWEPEEELANGFLNLTKVLNKNVVKDEVISKPIIMSPPPIVIAVTQLSTPLPIELKVEACKEVHNHSIIATLPKMVATVRPYEFEIQKKRRRLSKSCSDVNPSCSASNVTNLQKLSTAGTEANPAATNSTLQKATKLHQPWLSPGNQQDDEDEDEEASCNRERTESFNSSTSTSESIVGVKDDLDNNNVEPSSSQEVQSIRSENFISNIDPKTATSKLSGLLILKPRAEFRQPSGAQAIDEGKAECNVCGKIFSRASQLTLHMNIHYLERPFRCEPCGTSFRTKGHLIKHRRSSSHDCKVYLTEAWGVANEENPRPFKCADCKIAFRIHGHLAKHLRSKMHIMRMECLGKLPFGIYFEMEKSGMNLNEIDTTDCDMSLVSLQNVAKKIYGDTWVEKLTVVPEESV